MRRALRDDAGLWAESRLTNEVVRRYRRVTLRGCRPERGGVCSELNGTCLLLRPRPPAVPLYEPIF